MRLASIALASIAIISLTAASPLPADQVLVISKFTRAWDAADAKALGQLFEADGRLVIPDGMELTGRDAIAAFYASAFERGYRGSKGRGEVMRVTQLTPQLAIIEGEWSIDGAKSPDGSQRERESGQFSAVIRKSDGTWRIIVLREMQLAR